LETQAGTRIQLCGRLVVELVGRRVEAKLPGRQGRLLFAYLAATRSRRSTRSELVAALWPQGAPDAAESSLASLLSKLRRVLGADLLDGKSELRLALPADAWIDLEDVRLRALECAGTAGLRMGGAELATAERAGRALVEAAPFRESGYRLLMEALAARDNVAEALRVYDGLRVLLREELGVAPGQAAQDLHRRLLAHLDDVRASR
jgi:SARP family transcriptional regulator, regulator of embCAB operon